MWGYFYEKEYTYSDYLSHTCFSFNKEVLFSRIPLLFYINNSESLLKVFDIVCDTFRTETEYTKGKAMNIEKQVSFLKKSIIFKTEYYIKI